MCDCIERIQNQLKESGRNTQLDIPITFSHDTMDLNADRVQIATRKLDRNKSEKPLPMIPSFCPFCGKAYKSLKAGKGRKSADRK